METPKVAEGWTFKYNYIPGRIGAYFSIESNGMKIDAEVREWLDENLTKTSKQNARYIYARRFSYDYGTHDALPTHFAISIK